MGRWAADGTVDGPARTVDLFLVGYPPLLLLPSLVPPVLVLPELPLPLAVFVLEWLFDRLPDPISSRVAHPSPAVSMCAYESGAHPKVSAAWQQNLRSLDDL